MSIVVVFTPFDTDWDPLRAKMPAAELQLKWLFRNLKETLTKRMSPLSGPSLSCCLPSTQLHRNRHDCPCFQHLQPFWLLSKTGKHMKTPLIHHTLTYSELPFLWLEKDGKRRCTHWKSRIEASCQIKQTAYSVSEFKKMCAPQASLRDRRIWAVQGLATPIS